MQRPTTRPGMFVRMICALALLCIGLAHQAPLSESSIPSSELIAYTLPDGTVPPLCLDGDHGRIRPAGEHAATGCEACRLAASVILAAPADAYGQPIIRMPYLELALAYDDVGHPPLIPADGRPRAPPPIILTA